MTEEEEVAMITKAHEKLMAENQQWYNSEEADLIISFNSMNRIEMARFEEEWKEVCQKYGHCIHGKTGPHPVMGSPAPWMWLGDNKPDHSVGDGCDPPHALLGVSYIGSNDCPGPEEKE